MIFKSFEELQDDGDALFSEFSERLEEIIKDDEKDRAARRLLFKNAKTIAEREKLLAEQDKALRALKRTVKAFKEDLLSEVAAHEKLLKRSARYFQQLASLK